MFKVPLKYVKPFDYLFILRPTLFFPIWIMMLAGYSGFYTFNGEDKWFSFFTDWISVLNFLLITLVSGAVFILNQLEDIETDKDNQKLFLISESYVRQKTAQTIAFIIISVSLIIFLVEDIYLFLINSLNVLFCGYLYNYKPFCWKDLPFLGVFINIVGGLFLFLSGWIIAGFGQWKAFIYVIPYLCAWGTVMLLTTIPDLKGDKLHDKITFAARFGIKKTIWTATIWVLFGFIVGIFNKDYLVIYSIVLSIPIFVIMVFKPTQAWIFACIRYPMLFIALLLCLKFPLFFFVLLVNYYISKVYYISRFGLDYPTFKVKE
ncbi:UbiA family prenyltransferase [candidate division KSB1 bacterium]|nr:UbiA family prenyltransferase [candidate division KSB1 bacterium]MBL7092529.1 UbiA family prenyltransferase [candidate division KSB1 bacterium]